MKQRTLLFKGKGWLSGLLGRFLIAAISQSEV